MHSSIVFGPFFSVQAAHLVVAAYRATWCDPPNEGDRVQLEKCCTEMHGDRRRLTGRRCLDAEVVTWTP